MMDQPATGGGVPRVALLLGYSGLLPQLMAVILVFIAGQWAWVALAAGYAYAALIFSFLGGVWWGQAVAKKNAPCWMFVIAVLPSLFALALFLPWMFGARWPGPSLFWLGLLIGASPLVDRAIGSEDARWARLRWHLSLGLGGLTLLLAGMALIQGN